MRASVAYGLTVWACVVGFVLLCALMNWIANTIKERKMARDMQRLERYIAQQSSNKLWAETKDIRIINNAEEFRHDFGANR